METSIRSFVPLDKLGEGSFASVYKVQRVCDQQVYALKKIRIGHLSPKAKENALNEVRLLASLQSPYITKYYEAFFDQQIECLCIVMELADQGDLRKVINNAKNHKKLLTELEIWKVIIHLLHGLKILHGSAILHRDLKCENILVSGGYYKIGDMNVSKINKEGLVCTQTGTPYYASPEVWQDRPYNEKSDIWSLGCIIYQLAALRPPFTGSNMNDLHKNIMRGSYHPIPKIYSNQLAEVVYQCLKLNPNERPSVQDLLSNWSLKMYENICIDFKIESMQTNVNMLKTITLPKNIKDLNKCLPKPNYQSASSEREHRPELVDVKALEKVQSERKSVEEVRLIKEEPVYKQPKYIKNQAEDKSQKVPKYKEVERKSPDKQEECFPLLDSEDKEPQKKVNIFESDQERQKQRKQVEGKPTQASSSQKQLVSECDIPHAGNLSLKKMCSLHEIEKSDQKGSQSNKGSGSTKSLEEIESFNRLIERIKSSAKPKDNKIEKIERKKSRRMLIDLNSNKLPENRQKSRSKSMRRTERSISRDSIRQQPLKQKVQHKGAKQQGFCKEIGQNRQSERLLSKYMMNAPLASKYTSILEEAKGYLKRSASRKNKIF